MRRVGYTLVEMMIYSALFLLVGLAVVALFVVMHRAQLNSEATYAVTGQADTAIRWLRHDLEETALASVRSYKAEKNVKVAPALSLCSPRVLGAREEGLAIQVNEYGMPRWTKNVYYAFLRNGARPDGDLVRWEVGLTGIELDRLPKLAPAPSVVLSGGTSRRLLHSVVAPDARLPDLPNYRPTAWGGFRVQFVRRVNGSGDDTLADTNPALNTASPSSNTRLVEVELTTCDNTLGKPNFYAIRFRVTPRY